MAESPRCRGARLYDVVERAIDPVGDSELATLVGLDDFVAATLTPGVSDALEASGEFPAQVLSALLRGPVGAALTPVAQGGTLRWPTALRLCSRLAAHDLGVTLCLGGVVLGALPFIVAGNDEQRARFFADLRAGHVAGLGLSEWQHGSDLLGNGTVAVAIDTDGVECELSRATHFRLRGDKRPINNATRALNLVVLARTGKADDPFGSTLFHVRRGIAGLAVMGPADWTGYPGMDLSGIVLDDIVVPRSACIGKVGEGFVVTRATLTISRCGVAAMAVGASAAALDQAWSYARERRLYGSTIDALGGVQRLLARSFARLCEATALCRQAAHAVSWDPQAARAFTCAAKYVCPELLEDNVRDCGTILGARSLMNERNFVRLRRDAPILAIFDGTSQLQLDELWRTIGTSPTSAHGKRARDAWQAIVEPAPIDLGDNGRAELVAAHKPTRVLSALAEDGMPELAPFARTTRALEVAAASARRWPQARRFALSEAIASLFGLAALAQATARSSGVGHEALRAALRLTCARASTTLARSVADLCRDQDGALALAAELVAGSGDESECVDDVVQRASALLA